MTTEYSLMKSPWYYWSPTNILIQTDVSYFDTSVAYFTEEINITRRLTTVKFLELIW